MKSSIYALLFFLFAFIFKGNAQNEITKSFSFPIKGHFSEESKEQAIKYFSSKKGIYDVKIEEETHQIIIIADNQVDQKSLERLVRQLKEFYLPGECNH